MSEQHRRLSYGVSFFFILCSSGQFACSQVPVRPEKGTSGKHASDKKQLTEAELYQEIEDLFASPNDFQSLKEKVAVFKKRFPKGTLRGSVENLVGLSYLKQRNFAQAVHHLQLAVQFSTPNQAGYPYLLFNLASAQFEAHHYPEAEQSLDQIQTASIDPENQLKIELLRANLAEKKSQPNDALRVLLKASLLLNQGTLQATYSKPMTTLIEAQLKQISDFNFIETVLNESETSPLADILLFHLGEGSLNQGQREKGEGFLKRLEAQYPNSIYRDRAQAYLSSSQRDQNADKNKIGILLPLQGKFSRFASKTLQAIQMAFDIFHADAADSPFELILEDSGEDPQQAIQALDRLVLKHKVIAVIGPLLTKGIEPISNHAQELGIPLLSLARRVGSQQDFIFQAGLTPQVQARELAKYTIERLGLRRFAILYPSDKLGVELSQAFWDAVESLGGEIVGIESYPPGETDFRRPIDKLAGLYYTDARQRELNLLAQEREANHITKKTRKTEQFYQLRPIVDFEAVFIPEEPRLAGQILPTFAYRDVEGVRFLGTSSWNTDEFLSRTQPYSENATMVDAYWEHSKSRSSNHFKEQFLKVFHQEPSAMEALAYDTALILKDTLLSARGELSRSALRDKLRSVQGFSGVTGPISFKEGHFYRSLKVISVKNHQLTEVR